VVVERVRHLVRTTVVPFRLIAQQTGVNSGTISRWREKYGWHRPPGARPTTRRPGGRWQRAMIGRALATRLRIQCERLVAEIEAAEHVDPAKLAEAIRLLAQARAEQQVRRGKRLVPPPPPTPDELAATAQAKRQRAREKRAEAALKGWRGRYSKRAEHHRQMLEKG
jgi:hypothetical protein